MTVARTGPTSAIRRKKSRNATAVQTTPSTATAASTAEEGSVAGSWAIPTCALLYAPVGIAQRPATLPASAVLAAVAVLGVVCTAVAYGGGRQRRRQLGDPHRRVQE